MPPALWPLLLLELVGPIAATTLAYTWHKNMEEEIKEQHKREVMEHMEEEGYNIFIEFDEEDEAEFYFENEEAMQELIEKVIAAAKLKAEEEGIEFIDSEDDVEVDADNDEMIEDEDVENKGKVVHLGIVDDDDYPDYEETRELIDDDDYNDDNSNGFGI